MKTGNARLVEHGKNYVKDALRFAYFPQGVVGDFERWTDNDPVKGWKYACEMVGAMVTIADHLARAGDTELYEFKTTDGALGTAGRHHSGSPKSLETLVTDLMRYVDKSFKRYGTDRNDRAGSSKYLIDSVNDIQGAERINDLQVMPANRYYRSNYIRSVYTRSASGVPAYPLNPAKGSGDPEGGEAGIYPGVLFMYGKGESLPSPYGA